MRKSEGEAENILTTDGHGSGGAMAVMFANEVHIR
jgi:hypothetical protein